MLRDQFYKVLSSEKQAVNSFRSQLLINKDHPVFRGHFPELPVVPGVCMLQMVKERLEDELDQHFQLTRTAGIKFLAVINPLDHPELTMDVSYSINADHTILADASISAGEKVFFKIVKAVYKSGDGKG